MYFTSCLIRLAQSVVISGGDISGGGMFERRVYPYSSISERSLAKTLQWYNKNSMLGS